MKNIKINTKNKKLNIIVLAIAMICVLYFSLKDNYSEVIQAFLKIKILYFLLAVLVFLGSLVFKSLSVKTFLNKYYEDYNFKKTFNLTVIGQFFNGITPFQSGGQPFQVYMLKKEGKRIADSTSAMIKYNLSYQLSFVIICTLCLIINSITHVIENKSLLLLALIGFAINFALLVGLLFFVISKSKGVLIINKIIDFICKFKLFHRLNERKEKLKESVKRFYLLLSDITKDKLLLFKSIIYNVIYIVLLHLVPYFVFKSLITVNVSALTSFILATFVILMGNFIPIPGATGGIEYGFYAFYNQFYDGSILTSAMLIWRFITYILAMLIGFIALLGRKVKK